MIKITINPETEQSQTFTINKISLIIGADGETSPDITFVEEGLQADHLRIFFENERFFIHNQANDPLTTLNGEAFGKHPLTVGDQVQVGSTPFLIEELVSADGETIPDSPEDIDVDAELEKIDSLFAEQGSDEELLNLDVDSLLEAVEKLDTDIKDEESATEEPAPQPEASEPATSSLEVEETTPEEVASPTKEEEEAEEEHENVNLQFGEEEEGELDFLIPLSEEAEETNSSTSDEAPQPETPVAEEPPLDESAAIDEPEAQPVAEETTDTEQPVEETAEETTESDEVEKPEAAAAKTETPAEPAVPSPAPSKKEDTVNKELFYTRDLTDEDEVDIEGEADEVEFDDELFEFELLEKEKARKKLDEQIKRKQTLKKRLIFSAAFVVVLLTVVSSWFVSSVKDSNAQFEALAAQGVSDIAMAISHAKVYGDAPENGFWDEPEFLNTSLEKVLPPKYRVVSSIGNKADLRGTPYDLKIFSHNNSNEFLVTAVPKAGFLQWLLPKRGVYVDSETMILQITKDLYSLNNLPAPREAESIPSLTSTSISKKTEKVSLSYLKNAFEEGGFALPETLAASVPGAHRYLYNAPRYYLLTKEFLKRASLLNQSIITERDLRSVAKLYDNLFKFHQLVFYSAEGRAHAILALKGFQEHFPDKEIVAGYLTFNIDNGLIRSAHLLSDDSLEGPFNDSLVAAEAIGMKIEKSASARVSDPDTLEPDHPLYTALADLSEKRRRQLEIAANKVVLTLNTHTKKETANAEEAGKNLMKEYFTVSQEQGELITKTLVQLYLDLVDKKKILSAKAFTNAVKELELDPFLPQALLEVSPELMEKFSLETRVEEEFKGLRGTDDLLELDVKVTKISSLLNPNQIQDPNALLKWQNLLRSEVLEKVGQLILSPNSAVSSDTFQANHRIVLDRILNNAKVSDEEERNFYLKEFDLLVEKYRATEISQRGKKKSKEIAALSEQLEKVSDKLAIIPINEVSATDDQDKRQNFGRLGKQIVIQKKSEEPTTDGDSDLKEAIQLLMQAKDSNRDYWHDILEARLLLTQTPKGDIINIFSSPLGFSSESENYFIQIRNTLNSYVRALQAVSTVRGKQQFQIQYEHLKKTQKAFLEEALNQSRTIQVNCSKLNKQLDELIQRLESLQQDYQVARTEGFFVQNKRHHLSNIKQLRKQISSLKSLEKKLTPITTSMAEAGSAYDQIISAELVRLNGDEPVTPKDVLALEKKANGIFFPKLNANNISQKITKEIEDKVSIVKNS